VIPTYIDHHHFSCTWVFVIISVKIFPRPGSDMFVGVKHSGPSRDAAAMYGGVQQYHTVYS